MNNTRSAYASFLPVLLILAGVSGTILHAQTASSINSESGVIQSNDLSNWQINASNILSTRQVTGVRETASIAPLAAAATGQTYFCDDTGFIFSIDPATWNILTYVGYTGYKMLDIAFDPSGQLYGTDGTSLYQIDATTAATTFIGNLGSFANSLEFRADGRLFAAGSNYIYRIDKSTGAATTIVTMYTQYQAGGDIAFDSVGNFYLTTGDGHLIRYNTDFTSGIVVGATGVEKIWGLIYQPDGFLYGFTDYQEIYKINTVNATATFVANINDSGYFVNGVAGATTRIQTAGTPPGLPTLTTPGIASIISSRPTISTLTPTLHWTAATGATGYGVYVQDMNSDTLAYNNDNVGNVTSLILPSGTLETGHSYAWYMRARNASGVGSYTADFYFQTVLPPVTENGVDYSYKHPNPTKLKSAPEANQFVIRYLSSTAGKQLTAKEVLALRQARLDIIFCFEYYPGRMKEGQAAGIADANAAVSASIVAGVPPDFFCYFCCDFDAQESDQPAINAYLDGVASVLGANRVGFYGGYGPMQRVLDAGKAVKGWQTIAWSTDKINSRIIDIDSRVSLYQHDVGAGLGKPYAGGTCDLDYAYESDLGQWSITEPVITATILQNATVKQPYSAQLQIVPGTGVASYKWSLLPGDKLPAGITLNATKGIISGKPTKAGMFFFSIKVTDAIKQADTKMFSLIVN